MCPRHLHNAAALPWEKLVFSFIVSNLVFSGSMWVAPRSCFLVLRWECRLGDGQWVTANA